MRLSRTVSRPGRPHPFHRKQAGETAGNVNAAIFAAQKKGIIFDVGYGGGSFVFRTLVQAFKAGFYPDTISTDHHRAYDLNSVARPEWNTLSPNYGPTGDPRWDGYATG